MSGEGLKKMFRLVVEGRWADGFVRRLGTPRERLRQEAIDLQRLCTCTTLWELRNRAGRPLTALEHRQLAVQVDSMGTAEHRQHTAKAVNSQIVRLARTLHEGLLQSGDPAHAGTHMAAACSTVLKQQAPRLPFTSPPSPPASAPLTPTQQGDSVDGSSVDPTQARRDLSSAAVADMLIERLGYAVRVGPSSVQHNSAGQGLFVRGEVPVGSVVALVPGLVYNRTQLTRMPNYPHITLNNDYLSSRYDMTIIDSLAWKRSMQSLNSDDQHSAPSSSGTTSESEYSAWALSALELRHPLALGHMINHPEQGMHPNVLEVSWDLTVDLKRDPPWLRAYLPVAPGLDLDTTQHEDAAEALLAYSNPRDFVSDTAMTIRGIALIATRTIRDGEEVLQNYRLNPYVPRPVWYVPYDIEEEKRRWTKFSLSNLF